MEYKTILNNTNNKSAQQAELTQNQWKNAKKPIAFFDSGVGGLTVYNKVRKLLPEENCLYFGDTKNMPYGEKSESELIRFADNIFKFFEQKQAKAVVIACNTSSAIAYEKLKDKYNFKIYPIIQTVCSNLANLKDLKKLAIIATPATINSHAYLKEIHKFNKDIDIFEISAPNWVKIVEEHRIDSPESVKQVQEILEKVSEFNPDKIVLACTHYPYLMNILKTFIPEEKFIDPAIYFAENIKEDLTKNNLLNDKFEYEKFYVSDKPENFKIASKLFYDVKDLPKLTIL